MLSLRSRVVLVIAAVSAPFAACSLVIPLDEQQCTKDEDCAPHGGSLTCQNHVCVGPPTVDSGGADASDGAVDPWGCLNSPPLPAPSTQTVTVTFRVFDVLSPVVTAGPDGGDDFTVVSLSGVPGVTVLECNPLDLSCKGPLAGPVVTDDAGTATITAAGDFGGYFTFTADGYLPTLLYPGNFLAGQTVFSPPVAYQSVGEIEGLAGELHLPAGAQTGADAGAGHAFFEAFDCYDRHAPGVAFTIPASSALSDGTTVQWYATGNNSLPDTSATKTEATGTGGVVNVKTGSLAVTAVLVDHQQTIGNVTIAIQPGAATFTWIRVRTTRAK